MNITIFENYPTLHTETILLDYDILGMCNSINKNIELTTDSTVECTSEDVIKHTEHLQALHPEYTKEEIIFLTQKILIEKIITSNIETLNSY